MKKRIVLFTALAGVCYLTLTSYVHGPAFENSYDCTGAETGHSNPVGCSTGSGTSCHSNTATPEILVTLELDSAGVPVTHYVGGQTYTVKITGTNNTSNNLPQFGFQVAAIKGTTPSVFPTTIGTFASTGLPEGVRYTPVTALDTPYFEVNIVEHSHRLSPISGTGGTGTVYSESFGWTAPAAGTGSVSFWGALNAVNGDSIQNANDLWNTTHLFIDEETTGVPEIANNFSITTYPNPVINNLQLQLTNAVNGRYNVEIYDLNGKIIYSKGTEVSGSNYSTGINTNGWPMGAYILRIATSGAQRTMTIVKQ